MTPSLKDLGLENLSADDKLKIADALWECVEEEIANAPLTEAQKAEIERRLALCDAEPNRGTPVREVIKKMRDEFGWPTE
jgi:putative addiction module component (TIGR02574 family)